MDPKEESNFLDNYQKNYFQESNTDLFKTADIKRKLISQSYKASHTLLNNTASCDLLKDNLASYTDFVNDLNGINNYADNIKVLTPQIVENDCAKWKSSLDSLDLDELLKPLACEKNCTNISDMKDQLNILFEKNYEEPIKNQNNPIYKKKFENIFQGCNNPNQAQNSNFAKNNVLQPSNNFNKQGSNKPSYERSFLNRNYCDIRNYTNTTTVNNSQQERKKSYSQEEDDKSNRYNMFKTAKDELQEQNVKKHGKVSGNQNYNAGVKKSLGTATRRGVNSKFRSPMLVDDDGGSASLSRKNLNSNIQPEEEEIDERLKNIDPKMVELIRSEIMDSGTRVNWEDIVGLDFAKNAIQEAVVWPLLRPDIFTGLRRPPKGILLFGPPGTGKTLIGKCIASQSQSTFFSISASSLTSKWIGDGEKMVRAMFAVARVHQPAVIFIDEIDSLLSQRSDSEHESSRRIKTEFLVQLDGAATADDERILLVGATNRPQELDEAARRRFVKRLYIPLPEKQARLEIVNRLMSSERNNLTETDIDEIAELTDGYSGADMKNLCSEASLGPIRSIDFKMIQNIQADEVRPVTTADFKKAINRVRASVSPSDLDQYVVWDKTYGSGGW